jgi:hypothetical protein
MSRTWILPNARIEGLLFRNCGAEQLVYDQRQDRAVSLDALASAVLSHCDGRTSFDVASERVRMTLGRDVPDEAIVLALGDLRDHGLLDSEWPASAPTFSRRALIRRGFAGIAATTVVAVMIPTALEAQSLCVPGGQTSSGTFGDIGSQACVDNLIAACCTGRAVSGSCSCNAGTCSGAVVCASCIASGQTSSGTFGNIGSQVCVTNLIAACCSGQAASGSCSCNGGVCSGSVVCA